MYSKFTKDQVQKRSTEKFVIDRNSGLEVVKPKPESVSWFMSNQQSPKGNKPSFGTVEMIEEEEPGKKKKVELPAYTKKNNKLRERSYQRVANWLMNVDQKDNIIADAIDTAEGGLQDRIYNHKFRERDERKDVSPEKFISGNGKNAEDRLRKAEADSKGMMLSKEVWHQSKVMDFRPVNKTNAPAAGLRLNIKVESERIKESMGKQQAFDTANFDRYNMVNADFHRKDKVDAWLTGAGFLGATKSNLLDTHTGFSPGEDTFRQRSFNPDFVRGGGEDFPVQRLTDAQKMNQTAPLGSNASTHSNLHQTQRSPFKGKGQPTFPSRKLSYAVENQYKIQTNGLYDTYQRLNGIKQGLSPNKTVGGDDWSGHVMTGHNSKANIIADLTKAGVGSAGSTQSGGIVRFSNRKNSVPVQTRIQPDILVQNESVPQLKGFSSRPSGVEIDPASVSHQASKVLPIEGFRQRGQQSSYLNTAQSSITMSEKGGVIGELPDREDVTSPMDKHQLNQDSAANLNAGLIKLNMTQQSPQAHSLTERKIQLNTFQKKKISLPQISTSKFQNSTSRTPNFTMGSLAKPMKQARLSVRNNEQRSMKVDETLKHFFTQNKLYLKSNNERATIGPKHIQNQLAEFKIEQANIKEMHDANMAEYNKGKAMANTRTRNLNNSSSVR